MGTSRAGKRILAILVVLLVGFVLGEVGLRIVTLASGKTPPHADVSTEYEWRWALEHLESGSATLEGDGRHHPDLGWVTKSNLDREDVHTNAAGIRADREFPPAKPEGVRRIVLVGDSYTFGFNVADEHAFAAVLQREWLPDWEVINLGVSGYGVDQAVLLAESIGAGYEPDVVVLGFFVRDFQRNLLRFRGYRKPYFELEDDGSLRLRGVPVPSPRELFDAYASGRERIGGFGYSWLLAKVASKLRGAVERRSIDADAPSWRLMAGILRRFRDAAREREAAPFLLVIPERLDRHVGSSFEVLDRLAMEEAARLELPAVSMTPVFQAEEARRPGVPLYQDPQAGGHLSIEGNAIVARTLFEAMRESELLD